MHVGERLIETALLKDDERILLKMLSTAFIEIRAAKIDFDDTDRALAYTFAISDIHHNFPSGIANGRPFDEIISRARATAKRHGLEHWFDRRLTSSRKAVS